MSLNNREIIILILSLIGIFFIIAKKELRILIPGILKSFLHWKIITPIFLMLAYALLLVLIFYKVNLWDFSLLKDTIFWTGAAFIMLMNYRKISDNFKSSLKENLRFVIILEFLAGLYAFNIFGELILVPSVIFLVMVSTVAGLKKETLVVKKLTDGVVSIIGLYILTFAVYHIIVDFSDFWVIYNLKTFLLPIIFTILYLPFIYFVALYAEYEMLFVRLEHVWLKNNESLIRYAKKQAFLVCGLSLRKVKNLSAKSAFVFIDMKDKSDVRKVMNEI